MERSEVETANGISRMVCGNAARDVAPGVGIFDKHLDERGGAQTEFFAIAARIEVAGLLPVKEFQFED